MAINNLLKPWKETLHNTLLPFKDLDVDSRNPANWVATGSDPQFQVSIAHELSTGWYELEVALASGNCQPMWIYVDYGAGYTEYERLSLPNARRGKQKRIVFRLLSPVQGIRLKLSSGCGSFYIKKFYLKKVGWFRAGQRLLQQALSQGTFNSRKAFVKELWSVLRAFDLSNLGEVLYRRASRHTENSSYVDWIKSNTSFDPQTESLRLKQLPWQPLISITVPTHNSDVRWLEACIDSVLNQVYSNWELCIADDASSSRATLSFLRAISKRDSRIKVVFRKENGHISEATNTAARMASGDLIGLLDHDDELHPMALAEVVFAINKNPKLRLIYTDEDKIDEEGIRFDPYFKPDWNYELLLGQNFISHFGVYERKLFEDIGGFRRGFEGSQDHDLALRCIEQLDADEIGHIPKVLYHWRTVDGSTSTGLSAKSYATGATKRAVEDHLARVGICADVQARETGGFLTRYILSPPFPLVTLIITRICDVEHLHVTLTSIFSKTSYPYLEILLVDDKIDREDRLVLPSQFKSDSRIRILDGKKSVGPPAACNFAASEARGTIIGLIDSGIEVISENWLHELVSLAIQPDSGAVGCMVLYSDDTIQHAGFILGLNGLFDNMYSRHHRSYPGQMGRALLMQSITAMSTSCIVFGKDKFLQAGGFDERFQTVLVDIDFCLRIRELGVTNIWTPNAVMRRHNLVPPELKVCPKEERTYGLETGIVLDRWSHILANDPAYNPNLTLNGRPFGLASKPR